MNTNANIYGDISELPIEQFNRSGEYSILNSGIGYTIQDIVNHLDRIAIFIFNGKKEETVNQRKNLHQCIWNCLRGYNLESLEFMCFHEKTYNETDWFKKLNHNIDEATIKATGVMGDINKLMQLFDMNLKSWSTQPMITALTALKQVLPYYVEKRAQQVAFEDSDKLESLKKKFNFN